MKQEGIASPGLSAGRTSPIRARARPSIIAARALLALVIAVSGLAVASGAQAQQATPRVTIAARYPTALQGIDPLVYDVTRSGTVAESLDVSVTIASGIVSERKLSRTVTIPAGEAVGALSVPTDNLASGAVPGDVTATIVDGSSYDVGDPSSASIRLQVGDPLVTVRFSEESYSVDEGVGVVTGSELIARTAPGVPTPNTAIPVAVGFVPGTATSSEDYAANLLLLSFASGGWTVDGDTFVARLTVPVTIVDDTEVEDDETLSMRLVRPPDLAETVDLVSADGSGTECPALDGCSATMTILDDEPPSDDQEAAPGEVTIEAVHPTALQGIDRLRFRVTRSVAADYDLEVPVTLTSGIIEADRLSHTVTVPANEASAELALDTITLDPAAETGDVTATVGDGESHDVGDPSSATVRVYVGDTLVTVRFSADSYALDESVGATTDEISVVAQTAAGVPAPTGSVGVLVQTEGGTAGPSDYDLVHPSFFFGSQPIFPWIAVDDVYQSEIGVPLTVHDDDLAEGDETLQLTVNRAAGTAATVAVAPADSTAVPCGASGCSADVTIVDDDSRSVVVSQTGELAVEEGGSASYTVALGSEPTGEVTVTPDVYSTTDSIVSVSPALRFTPDVWAVPQTVTVTALIDFNDVDGSATITHTVTGADYGDNGVTAPSVTVAEEDLYPEVPPPGDVTIAAKHPTALQGIDDIVFTLTLEAPADYDRVVPVTLSPGIIEAGELMQIVPIPANQTSAELVLSTDNLDPAAVTGDVTATVAADEFHDVLEPASASVRVYVGDTLLTVRLSSKDYELDESVGQTNGEISVIARTAPHVPAPMTKVQLAVDDQEDTAVSPDDYTAPSKMIALPEGPNGAWVPDGDSYMSQIPIPVSVVDDEEVEGDEAFRLMLKEAPGLPSTIDLVPADATAPPCKPSGCEATVVIRDDDVEVPDPVNPDPVVVTLVHVPDGTVIPDDSTLTVGETVEDGSTFSEDARVLFRLLFSAGDGGPAPGGADVELSFEWIHDSPIVPVSGEISRIVLSLYRVDVWDSAVQILDNEVGNPDSTLRVRITGCERNGCVIGTPNEITVTIADDDGGPEAAPPGKPDVPRLVCASAGDGYDSTGIAVNWQAPTFVGGAAVEGYEIQYRRRIGAGNPWVWGEWQAWPHNGTATSTAITGLDVETLYGVQVRAFNANGPGQWSLPNTFGTGQPDRICEILDELTPK